MKCRARIHGYNQRRCNGVGASANPYPAGTDDHNEWLAGWKRAAADDNAAQDADAEVEVGRYGETDEEEGGAE